MESKTVFQKEIDSKKRFRFGKNWKLFINNLNSDRIEKSKISLLEFLEKENLNDLSFLDVGSGSGLSSLSAILSGAKVHSFDFDTDSVECTKYLKDIYSQNDSDWIIEQGSATDEKYMNSLPLFDIVYSWGVLHHTGNMSTGLNLVEKKVKDGGLLFLALYNDQGWKSKLWFFIKRFYVKSPFILKQIILFLSFIRLWGPTTIKDFLKLKPFQTWKNKINDRGMSPIYDVVDWVGGYPFEVSKPEDIIKFYSLKGYVLVKLKDCGKGKGCNEYLFKKL